MLKDLPLWKRDVIELVLNFLPLKNLLQIQLVCRQFYDKRVPAVFVKMPSDTRLYLLKKLTRNMLNCEPVGVDEATLLM